ncbi:DUF4333 domain-containing protein [Nocardia crassostreae]|uniref:DUF4333 domain-containing protein n=1 Tax=Nocardia crassostreae TaxID=53428 RepID=UPI000830F2EC|nr:DUF4333 domain-containing protein [Nocardia crassostreae]
MKSLRVIALSLFVTVAAGCTASAGDPRVEEADLERSVQQTLTEQVGQRPESIDCPGDLTGTVGTTMRCTLSSGGSQIGLTVQVTGVNDGKIAYDVEVDRN